MNHRFFFVIIGAVALSISGKAQNLSLDETLEYLSRHCNEHALGISDEYRFEIEDGEIHYYRQFEDAMSNSYRTWHYVFDIRRQIEVSSEPSYSPTIFAITVKLPNRSVKIFEGNETRFERFNEVTFYITGGDVSRDKFLRALNHLKSVVIMKYGEYSDPFD